MPIWGGFCDPRLVSNMAYLRIYVKDNQNRKIWFIWDGLDLSMLLAMSPLDKAHTMAFHISQKLLQILYHIFVLRFFGQNSDFCCFIVVAFTTKKN